MRQWRLTYKLGALFLFTFVCFIYNTKIVQGGNASPEFISFVQGDPGVPGDGVFVSPSGGVLGQVFNLDPTFPLAGVTDGITVTSFPSPGDLADFQGDLFVIIIFENNSCRGGIGVFANGQTTFNGVTGFVANFPQSDLEDIVSLINLAPSCGDLTLGDFSITELEFEKIVITPLIPDLDAVAIGFGQNNVPQPTTERTVVINRRTDPRGSILLTYQVIERSINHITLDLTLQNVARTWFIVRREGAHSASDQEIPFVFLLGPDGVRSFPNIRFMRGEFLRLIADKPGSLGDVENLALGALSVDMFGRGLFGLTLPPNIFDDDLIQLLEEYIFLYAETILTKIFVELEIKALPKIVKEVFTLIFELDLSDPSTRELLDELYEEVGGATEWASRIVEQIVQVLSLPIRRALVQDLWHSTLRAPDSGFAEIEAN